MHRLRSLVLPGFLAAATLVGCSDSTSPGTGDSIAVTAAAGEIRITNVSTSPVFVMVTGRQQLVLIDWVQVVGGPSIPPGGEIVRTYPSFAIPEEETEAIVHRWHAVRGEEGNLEPGPLNAMVVEL